MSFLDIIKELFSNPYVQKLINIAVSCLKKTLSQISKEDLTMIKNKIVAISTLDISGAEKFQRVSAEVYALLPGISRSYLNLLIETLIQELKASKVI